MDSARVMYTAQRLKELPQDPPVKCHSASCHMKPKQQTLSACFKEVLSLSL